MKQNNVVLLFLACHVCEVNKLTVSIQSEYVKGFETIISPSIILFDLAKTHRPFAANKKVYVLSGPES